MRRDGVGASLEAIARRAGVGSATLHRHFRSRRDLLEVLYRDDVTRLCGRAAAKPGEDPGGELAAWLEELTVYTASHRGLAAALLAGPNALSAEEVCCSDVVLEHLKVLVARAIATGALRAGVIARDVLALVNAIAAANENAPRDARRLVRLALGGIRA